MGVIGGMVGEARSLLKSCHCEDLLPVGRSCE